eukprot:130190_1
MEAVHSLFKYFRFPDPRDTAPGRRKQLNSQGYYANKSPFPSQDVSITSEYVEKPNGSLLFTKLFEPKDKASVKGMICFSDGVSCSIDFLGHRIGVEYAASGFVVCMFDYAGHGRSDGPWVIIEDFEETLVAEAVWIYTYIINKHIKSDPLYSRLIDIPSNYFLSGRSMGGAVAILAPLEFKKQKQINIKGVAVAAPLV